MIHSLGRAIGRENWKIPDENYELVVCANYGVIGTIEGKRRNSLLGNAEIDLVGRDYMQYVIVPMEIKYLTEEEVFNQYIDGGYDKSLVTTKIIQELTIQPRYQIEPNQEQILDKLISELSVNMKVSFIPVEKKKDELIVSESDYAFLNDALENATTVSYHGLHFSKVLDSIYSEYKKGPHSKI